jgi:hypothetical protein
MSASNDGNGRKPSAAYRFNRVERVAVYGNVNVGYDTVVDAEDSTDITSYDNVNYASAKDAMVALQLGQLLQLLDSGLKGAKDDDETRQLRADLATLRAQHESPSPKRGIIRESLSSVRRILEGAASELLAAHTPEVIALAEGLLRSLQ